MIMWLPAAEWCWISSVTCVLIQCNSAHRVTPMGTHHGHQVVEKWIETGVFMILASQLFNLGDLSGDPWFRFGLFFKLSPRSLPLKTVQQHGSLIPGRQELAFILEPKAWIYKFGWGKKTVKSYWRWLFRWRLGRFGHDDKHPVTMGESSSLILPRDLY